MIPEDPEQIEARQAAQLAQPGRMALGALITLLALAGIWYFLRPSRSLPGSNPSGSGPSFLSSHYRIRVSGSPGLHFTGNYGTFEVTGASSSKSVEGVVPAEYPCEGAFASCVFQKSSEAGSLKVEIVQDADVVKSEETTAAFGIVTLAK